MCNCERRLGQGNRDRGGRLPLESGRGWSEKDPSPLGGAGHSD